jgi:hypothetical protein
MAAADRRPPWPHRTRKPHGTRSRQGGPPWSLARSGQRRSRTIGRATAEKMPTFKGGEVYSTTLLDECKRKSQVDHENLTENKYEFFSIQGERADAIMRELSVRFTKQYGPIRIASRRDSFDELRLAITETCRCLCLLLCFARRGGSHVLQPPEARGRRPVTIPIGDVTNAHSSSIHHATGRNATFLVAGINIGVGECRSRTEG